MLLTVLETDAITDIRQLTSRSSPAVARLATSTHKQTARKPFSSCRQRQARMQEQNNRTHTLLNASGFFNVGVPFVAIRYNAFSGSLA